ncbi:MAG: hypothetical protein MK538_01860 [Planctomycetes bacterium]|nr:hypothetical protein [Planctomycetota bacterium]
MTDRSANQELPADCGNRQRVVVLRHGIMLNRYFMLPMERYFKKRGYEVYNCSYPTTKKCIAEHAQDLADEMKALQERVDENAEFYFVTQSMGGLVLRYALTHFSMPPARRAVLMVPPNQGSACARFFKRFPPYRWIFGKKAGMELAGDPPGIFAECGTPEDCEIGIIAGSISRSIYPANLEKPHDGVVSVSETQLPPFPVKVLPYGHTPILFVRYAMEEAEHFLVHGKFRAEGPSVFADAGSVES